MKMVCAQLGGATLDDAHLHLANLTKACLQRAELGRADLSDAKLLRADLRDAVTRSANFLHAQMVESDLRPLANKEKPRAWVDSVVQKSPSWCQALYGSEALQRLGLPFNHNS